MFNRLEIALLITTTAVSFTSSPSLASPQRYPTNAEVQREMRDFRRQVPLLQQSSQFGKGYRQPALSRFVKARSRIDPSTAPFLGTWQAQETDWNFYPSQVKGRVCILFRSPQPDASLGLGYVSKVQLLTNEVETAIGRFHTVFVR